MKKKFLTFILSICLIVPAMFCLTACGQQQDIQFRVEDNYIQWSYDGKDWKNGISLDDLEKEEVVDEDLKENAYNLFKTTLIDGSNAMNNIGKYKVRYEYNDRIEYESYDRFSFTYSYEGRGGEYCHSWSLSHELRLKNDSLINGKVPYALKITPYNSGIYIPTTHYETYFMDESFEEVCGSYSVGLYQNGNDINNKVHTFIKFMQEFDYTDIYDFEFNESGDLKISFNYTDNNSNKFIYEYCVNNAGKIEKCYVYEKDFLHNKRGEIYCKINYIANESDIALDMVKKSLDVVMKSLLENDPDAYQLTDVFGYKIAG